MQNLLSYGNILLAETIKLQPNGDIGKAVQDLSIGSIIGGALRLILVVAALAFFFILVLGGIHWILSGGDKAKTEGARNQITAALVGLVIVFSAWAIAQLIGTFFGLGENGIFNLKLPDVTGN